MRTNRISPASRPGSSMRPPMKVKLARTSRSSRKPTTGLPGITPAMSGISARTVWIATEGVCTPSDGSWEAGADIADSGKDAVGRVLSCSPIRTMATNTMRNSTKALPRTRAKSPGSRVKVALKREDAISLDPNTNCIKTKEWSELEPGLCRAEILLRGHRASRGRRASRQGVEVRVGHRSCR